jgi:hypothetical protein
MRDSTAADFVRISGHYALQMLQLEAKKQVVA